MSNGNPACFTLPYIPIPLISIVCNLIMSNVSFNDQQQRQQIVMRSFTSENCIHFTVVDEIGSKGDKIDGREPLPSKCEKHAGFFYESIH